jgi:hypothetical protein
METDSKPATVLGIDPGDKTGWAVLEKHGGRIVERGITRADDMPATLTRLATAYCIETVVYEEFILYANRAQQQTGSRFFASQVIGMIKFLAWQKGNIRLIVQPANYLKNCELITGWKKPTNHDESHDVDAINHALLYLIERHLASSVLEKEMGIAH